MSGSTCDELLKLMTAEEASSVGTVTVVIPSDPPLTANQTFIRINAPDSPPGCRRLVLTCFYAMLQKEFRPSPMRMLKTTTDNHWMLSVRGATTEHEAMLQLIMFRANWQITSCVKCQKNNGTEVTIDAKFQDYVVLCGVCGFETRRRLSIFPTNMRDFCHKILEPWQPKIITNQHQSPTPPPLNHIDSILEPPVTKTDQNDPTDKNAENDEKDNNITNDATDAIDLVWDQKARLRAFYQQFAFHGNNTNGRLNNNNNNNNNDDDKTDGERLQRRISLWGTGNSTSLGSGSVGCGWGSSVYRHHHEDVRELKEPKIPEHIRYLEDQQRLKEELEIISRSPVCLWTGALVKHQELSEQAVVTGCKSPPPEDSMSVYQVYDHASAIRTIAYSVPKQQLVPFSLGDDEKISSKPLTIARYTVRLAECGECKGSCQHFMASEELNWCLPPMARQNRPWHVEPVVEPVNTLNPVFTHLDHDESETKEVSLAWFWNDLRRALHVYVDESTVTKNREVLAKARCVWRSTVEVSNWSPRQTVSNAMNGFLCSFESIVPTSEHEDQPFSIINMLSIRLEHALNQFLVPVLELLQEIVFPTVMHRMWSILTLVEFAIKMRRLYRPLVSRFLKICSGYGIITENHIDLWSEWDAENNQWRAKHSRDDARDWFKKQLVSPYPALCARFAPHLFYKPNPNISTMLDYADTPSNIPPELQYDPDDTPLAYNKSTPATDTSSMTLEPPVVKTTHPTLATHTTLPINSSVNPCLEALNAPSAPLPPSVNTSLEALNPPSAPLPPSVNTSVEALNAPSAPPPPPPPRPIRIKRPHFLAFRSDAKYSHYDTKHGNYVSDWPSAVGDLTLYPIIVSKPPPSYDFKDDKDEKSFNTETDNVVERQLKRRRLTEELQVQRQTSTEFNAVDADGLSEVDRLEAVLKSTKRRKRKSPDDKDEKDDADDKERTESEDDDDDDDGDYDKDGSNPDPNASQEDEDGDENPARLERKRRLAINDGDDEEDDDDDAGTSPYSRRERKRRQKRRNKRTRYEDYSPSSSPS